MNRYQQTCFHIARKLLKQNDTELIFAPVSEKKIIINDRLGIYLTLQHQQAFVTNHVYHYDVVVGDRNWERLSKMYDGKVETIRQEYEDQIMSQIDHSLENIIKKVKSITDLTPSK